MFIPIARELDMLKHVWPHIDISTWMPSTISATQLKNQIQHHEETDEKKCR